ncbi:RNA polymerase sigma-70 factor [Streptomyces sp. NPDC050560]|uniref:RNA polymerase sigma-70 factor n=1 Tax=Streptomyces sp. NPDC050560 TaxID=3365630 RepID=UPI0037954546
MGTDTAVDVFEQHRPVLMGVAYRMLGGVADAEDVVQEAWLRWSAADTGEVRSPRAYLVRVTTRLAIDRLRHVAARREAYVGPWLPEPLATELDRTVPDVAERTVLADTVSLAVLVVLESLSPLERAVFVLREAFGLPYSEIAVTLERGEAAVRQLGARARAHVAERRPRYEVDPAERRELTERFVAAAVEGDLAGLVGLLAPDATLVGDSGGKAKGPLRVIEGADKVGRFVAAIAQQGARGAELRFLELNGVASLLVLVAGAPDTVVQLEVSAGRVARVYVLRNPDKLTGLGGSAAAGEGGAG